MNRAHRRPSGVPRVPTEEAPSGSTPAGPQQLRRGRSLKHHEATRVRQDRSSYSERRLRHVTHGEGVHVRTHGQFRVLLWDRPPSDGSLSAPTPAPVPLSYITSANYFLCLCLGFPLRHVLNNSTYPPWVVVKHKRLRATPGPREHSQIPPADSTLITTDAT